MEPIKPAQTIKSLMESQNSSEQKPTSNRAFVATNKGYLSKEECMLKMPLIEVVDSATGEVKQVHQYKVYCEWKDDCIKDPLKEKYTFPAYLVLQKHIQIHGMIKAKNFMAILRQFVAEYESNCKKIVVYDNTKHVQASVIFKSLFDTEKQKHQLYVNYLFPSRLPYTPYPF
jgi:hypothetical protein